MEFSIKVWHNFKAWQLQPVSHNDAQNRPPTSISINKPLIKIPSIVCHSIDFSSIRPGYSKAIDFKKANTSAVPLTSSGWDLSRRKPYNFDIMLLHPLFNWPKRNRIENFSLAGFLVVTAAQWKWDINHCNYDILQFPHELLAFDLSSRMQKRKMCRM